MIKNNVFRIEIMNFNPKRIIINVKTHQQPMISDLTNIRIHYTALEIN